MNNNQKLIIITGPSGVGKGTVIKEILKKDQKFWLSVSATTRNPRDGEIDGQDYYFLSKTKFKQMINDGLFLEWAKFAGNYYGTPLASINEKIIEGYWVILEIEVDGAGQVRKKFPNSFSIFLLPPNKHELEKRIRSRGTDKEESILKRLERADFEIRSSKDFDFVLKNTEIDETVNKVLSTIKKQS